MDRRFVFLGSVVNLLTLIVGLTLGFLVGTAHSTPVHAQATQQIIPIQPQVIAPSLGTNLLLAHEIQTDSIVANGYDLLKMHQLTLNYLANQLGANTAAIQDIVNKSKADKLYTLKPPAASKPQEKKP